MKNTGNVKENIIHVTTELIEQSGGNIKTITARTIAEKAGASLGLINYHFGSKEHLMTVCVQRIIEQVIAGFNVHQKYNSDQERLTAWAVYVFDFLFENAAISRISIFADLENYSVNSNSVHTQKGFMLALGKDIDDKDKQYLAFILTAAMQVAFLGWAAVKDLLGYDFRLQTDRAAYIAALVNTLVADIRKEGHDE